MYPEYIFPPWETLVKHLSACPWIVCYPSLGPRAENLVSEKLLLFYSLAAQLQSVAKKIIWVSQEEHGAWNQKAEFVSWL